MARATTKTWLPLDRWAELMGIHPLHFNGLSSDTYLANITCGMPWFQYGWQNADRISREEIAQAIYDAERQIAELVGYSLLPDWQTGERVYFDRPAVRELYNLSGRSVRGQRMSLQTRYGHVISGGVRVKTGIEEAAVVRTDEDGDGYSETVTVTVGTAVTDEDEIKVYYPGQSGADEWEIRPITVTIDETLDVATIVFKSWQIVQPDEMEQLDASLQDAEVAGSYLTTVDVYRVYNDPQTQVTFIWEQDTTDFLFGSTCCGSDSCLACQLGTQAGCFHNRDARLGIIVPAPATWSSDDQAFTGQSFSSCRGPDQALLYYYAGNRDMRLAMPKSKMEKFWELAVTYYSAGLLQKPSCGCDNVTNFIEHWQMEREYSSKDSGTYFQTMSQLTNPLGSTNGAKYAYDKVKMPGRKLGR